MTASGDRATASEGGAPAGPSVVRGKRVLTADGIRPATVHIADGRIIRVGDLNEAVPRSTDVVDAGDLVVMPGLVDTHVHVNEPGRTDWEGFETATRAAAAGGVTTLLDMPLNSIPATTSVTALHAKATAAQGKTWVDVGFIGGVVPGNASALGDLARAGVLAFKCFLVPSGVPEFAHVTRAGSARSDAGSRRARATAHGARRAARGHRGGDARGDRGRSDEVRDLSGVASRRGRARGGRARDRAGGGHRCSRAHRARVERADGASWWRHARERGVRIIGGDVPALPLVRRRPRFPTAPPSTSARRRFDAATTATGCGPRSRHGELDMIVSDHSPCPPILKRRDVGDFFVAWGGIASLQLGVAVVWTAMRERGSADRAARRVDERRAGDARRARANGRERIAPGYDADLVLFDPDGSFTVRADMLLHRHPLTPYLGAALRGTVEATYVRGVLAYDRRTGPARYSTGRAPSSSSHRHDRPIRTVHGPDRSRRRAGRRVRCCWRTMSSSRRRRRSSRRRRPSGARACTRSAGSGWMDGRRVVAARQATTGASLRLGIPGIIRGVVVDTSFFRGNYPESCSIEAATVDGHARPPRRSRANAHVDGDPAAITAAGRRAEPVCRGMPRRRSRISGSTSSPTAASRASAFTGRAYFDPARHHPGSEVDLAAAENGGQVLLVQRHVLRQPAQSHHAGPVDAHGRRLGDASSARTRTRLDDREARDARHAAPHRDRHGSLQGERAGPVHGRSV